MKRILYTLLLVTVFSVAAVPAYGKENISEEGNPVEQEITDCDLGKINLVSDVDVLIDSQYFRQDILQEGNEDMERLKETVSPSIISFKSENSRYICTGSAFIYKIEKNNIYFITAKHCTRNYKNFDHDLMFFNGETVHVPVRNIRTINSPEGRDLSMVKIPTELVPYDLLLQLKECVCAPLSEFKDGAYLYAYNKNFRYKKNVEKFFNGRYTEKNNQDVHNTYPEFCDKEYFYMTKLIGGMSGSPTIDAQGYTYGCNVSVFYHLKDSGFEDLSEIPEMYEELKKTDY